jgi:hypothetical protein
MKIPTKVSKAKEDICKKCKLKKSCGDLPGFCALIYYVPIAVVVIMLIFFLITMKL